MIITFRHLVFIFKCMDALVIIGFFKDIYLCREVE